MKMREREVYYNDIVVTECTATHKNSLSIVMMMFPFFTLMSYSLSIKQFLHIDDRGVHQSFSFCMINFVFFLKSGLHGMDLLVLREKILNFLLFLRHFLANCKHSNSLLSLNFSKSSKFRAFS